MIEESTYAALETDKRYFVECRIIKPNDPTPLSLVLPCLRLLSVVLLLNSGLTAEDPSQVTAPVKILEATSIPEEDPMQGMPVMPAPVQQPVLPDGRYPQYQLGISERNIPSLQEAKNPSIRFILFLEERPVLFEANIFIDDQPYGLMRERRIKNMLLDINKHPSSEVQARDEAEQEQIQEPAGNNESEDESPEDDSEKEKPEVNPPTVAEYRNARDATDFLRRYIQTIGPDLGRDEIHWLLNNRIDGPVVLKLVEKFQHFRASKRPLFQILDQNRDGQISESEIEDAVKNLNECDLNRDRIVSYLELDEVADDPRNRESELPEQTLMLVLHNFIPHENVLEALFHQYDITKNDSLLNFDTNANGKIEIGDFPNWAEITPDFKIDVNFDLTDSKNSSVRFTQTSKDKNFVKSSIEVDGRAIRVSIDSQNIEITCLQGQASDQISIGAIKDGYPLLPFVDPNSDGMLTIRELRTVDSRLRKFDQNSDHLISDSEAQPTIRLCIGLGPTVDSELADIRSLKDDNTTPTITGPDWFVRMDRNQDNDLMRDEFPGTDEQFRQLDTDADELISAQEANGFENVQETNRNKDSTDLSEEEPSDTSK